MGACTSVPATSPGSAYATKPSRDIVLQSVQNNDPAVNRRVRVFVSSTFKDMAAEREELAKNVFPQLKQYCESRRIFFSYVDLRWGITEEDSLSGQTISLCMDSIDQCRPYFLCMIGDRYGWAQTPDNKDELLSRTFANAIKTHPWLAKYADRSITELEVLYSALFYPELAANGHAMFFMRASDPALASQKLTADKAAERLKLISLKERIRGSTHAVSDYAMGAEGVTAFGEAVLKQLKTAIQNDFASDGVAGAEEKGKLERNTSAAQSKAGALSADFDRSGSGGEMEIIRNRHDYYAGRYVYFAPVFAPQYFPDINAYVNGKAEHGIYVVEGRSGSGKTGVLATWFSEMKRQQQQAAKKPDKDKEKEKERVFVLGHFVDASPTSGLSKTIMRRVITELHDFFQLGAKPEVRLPAPADITDKLLREQFWSYLEQCSRLGAKLVLLLEGLDNLNSLDEGRDLSWIPPRLPANVYIVSAGGASLSTVLRERGCGVERVVAMAPLTVAQQVQLVQLYLGQYSQKLSEKQAQLVVGGGTAAKPASERKAMDSESDGCANPLFLIVLLEELRICSSFEQLEQHILRYRKANTTAQLYDVIFERLEGEHGVKLVSDILTLIACSRKGMSESELQTTISVARAQKWIELILSLGPTLANRSGLIGFFNEHVGRAVAARYFNDTDAKTYVGAEHVHERLAGFFEGARIKAGASPAQRTGALSLVRGAAEEAALMTWRAKEELPFHLHQIIQLCSGISQPQDRTGGTSARRLTPDELAARDARRDHATQRLTALLGSDKSALVIFDALYTAGNKFDLLRYWRAVQPDPLKVAEVYVSMVNAIEAAQAGTASNDEQTELSALMGRVCAFLEETACYKAAIALWKRKLTLDKTLYGEDAEVIAAQLMSLAGVCAPVDDLKSAQEYAKQALAIRVKQLALANDAAKREGQPVREMDAAVAQTKQFIAFLHKKLAEYPEAIAGYEELMALRAQLFTGERDPGLARLLYEFGDVYRKQAAWAKALDLYQQALRIHEIVYGKRHPEYAITAEHIGMVYKKLSNYDEADKIYRECLAILTDKYGDQNPRTAGVLENLADVARKKGNFTEAEQLYNRALKINKYLLGDTHINVVKEQGALGLIAKKKGQYAEAEKCFLNCLATLKATQGEKHYKYAGFQSALGDVYRKMGMLERALTLYTAALTTFQETLGPTHIEVGETMSNIGVVYKKQADYEQSISYVSQAIKIGQDSCGPEHPKTAGFMLILADVYRKMGKWSQARALYEKVIPIFEKTLGAENVELADPITGYAVCHFKVAEYKQTETLLTRAKTIVEKSVGTEHITYTWILECLGDVCRMTGRSDEAEQLYRQALSINTRILGPEHVETGENYRCLAVLRRTTHPHDALKDMQRAIDIVLVNFGNKHAKYAYFLNDYGDVLVESQMFTEAEQSFQRALDLNQRIYGEKSAEISHSLGGLGVCAMHLKKTDVAESFLKRSVDMIEEILGAGHPYMAQKARMLASLYRSSGKTAEAEAVEARIKVTAQ